jgi:hypothetical protein
MPSLFAAPKLPQQRTKIKAKRAPQSLRFQALRPEGGGAISGALRNMERKILLLDNAMYSPFTRPYYL